MERQPGDRIKEIELHAAKLAEEIMKLPDFRERVEQALIEAFAKFQDNKRSQQHERN